MSPANDRPHPPPDPRYQGFSLKSVCWGYREIFQQAIDGLLREGALGPRRQEVTAKFFDLLKRSDQNGFDHVTKEFLGALNPQTRWLLDVPGIFADVADLGAEFARTKLYYGIRFFETLSHGGFGDTPDELRNLLDQLHRLRQIDDDLAMAFLKGYRYLLSRLTPREVGLYADVGLQVFHRKKASGLAFMEGTLKSSESYIRSITHECRLDDVKPLLQSLLKALTGRRIEVAPLGNLDSDELYERGSSVVCLYRWLHLPSRIRDFTEAAPNRNAYLLAAIAAAGGLAENSFPCVHGHPEYETCRDLVGDDPRRLNLFQIIEHVRVLRRIRRRWPGARRLIDFGLEAERRMGPSATPADRLLLDAASAETRSPLAHAVTQLADDSINLFDTAERLDHLPSELRACPGLDGELLRAFTFLPDFLFPGITGAPPSDARIADLKRAARKHRKADAEGDGHSRSPSQGDGEPDDADDEEADRPAAAYVYDEWSQDENDYLRDYCLLHETAPALHGKPVIPDDIAAEGRRVSRVFERFKPDLARREKYLWEGDVINPDLLLEYLVQRRREPAPRVRFYERPRINRRDLAVLILLDSSGSTNEPAGRRDKIIDVEKHAALILGQGLRSLGDRFAICGFNSSGREHCAYFVYKDLDEAWSRETMARVLAARPSNSTRIGPALRHSGHRLSRVAARQRLIILITDGRPMDSNYDPNSRYAQHDVRMACEENASRGIHTFAISTEENSVADMEIMFPRRRFAILPDIRQLIRVLPRAYIHITT